MNRKMARSKLHCIGNLFVFGALAIASGLNAVDMHQRKDIVTALLSAAVFGMTIYQWIDLKFEDESK